MLDLCQAPGVIVKVPRRGQIAVDDALDAIVGIVGVRRHHDRVRVLLTPAQVGDSAPFPPLPLPGWSRTIHRQFVLAKHFHSLSGDSTFPDISSLQPLLIMNNFMAQRGYKCC